MASPVDAILRATPSRSPRGAGARRSLAGLAGLLVLAMAAPACQEGGGGLPPCEEAATAAFDSLGEGLVAVRSINGIRLEVLAGDAEGYHDGTRWTLLAVQGTTLALTPPCGASALEVVLDSTQVGLTVTAFDDAFGRVPLGSASSTEAVPVAEDPPYRRLTVTLPEGSRAGYAEIVVSGSACTDLCFSVLLRSVTFR